MVHSRFRLETKKYATVTLSSLGLNVAAGLSPLYLYFGLRVHWGLDEEKLPDPSQTRMVEFAKYSGLQETSQLVWFTTWLYLLHGMEIMLGSVKFCFN